MRGYHVVHMVPGPGNGLTVEAPQGWVSETGSSLGAAFGRGSEAPSSIAK